MSELRQLVDLLKAVRAVNRSRKYTETEMEEKGMTRLYVACKRGKGIEKVRQIVQEDRSQVDQPTKKGKTPLWESCNAKNYRVSKFLLECGADPMRQDNDIPSPFALAVSRGDLVAVDMFCRFCEKVELDYQAVPLSNVAGIPAIQHLLGKEGFPTLEYMLNRKMVSPNFTFMEGWTFLHVAVRNGEVAKAMCLIRCGANVNALKDDGFTPLHLAVVNDHKELVSILLINGADRSIPVGGSCEDKKYVGKNAVRICKDASIAEILDLY